MGEKTGLWFFEADEGKRDFLWDKEAEGFMYTEYFIPWSRVGKNACITRVQLEPDRRLHLDANYCKMSFGLQDGKVSREFGQWIRGDESMVIWDADRDGDGRPLEKEKWKWLYVYVERVGEDTPMALVVRLHGEGLAGP